MRLSVFFLTVGMVAGVSFCSRAQYVATWDPDADGDDEITVIDLLALLTVFEEVDTDGDGIFDSQDGCIGAIDGCGVCNGTGTDADADGLCDANDPCVGVVDACGVCNGPGPTVPVLDSIIFVTDSVYFPAVQEWYTFTYAADTLYTYVCVVLGCTDPVAVNYNPAANTGDGSCTYGPSQCGGLATVTFDGYTYPLVGIGTQCWFKENLRSDNYRNGDLIPGGLTDSQWTSTNAGAQTIYGEGASAVNQGSGDEVTNLALFGRLYNWNAVNDARGLCPTGWHVPTDAEWTALSTALGGLNVAGAALKASATDQPGWNGTNSSAFSGLPGGMRFGSYYGSFYNQGTDGYWWTSTAVGSNAWVRNLWTTSTAVARYENARRDGFSVRCLRN
jgi:uncharacterized protein (TIGR02145 family)